MTEPKVADTGQPGDKRDAGAAGRSLSPERRQRFREQPFHQFMDLDIEDQRQGYARIVMKTSERTKGGVGESVHGGMLATLVDIACINAVASAIGPDDVMNGTAELNISYLRPALGPVVVAEGRVLKKGRTLAVVDVDVSDGKGRLFAKGRVQYSLRQRA